MASGNYVSLQGQSKTAPLLVFQDIMVQTEKDLYRLRSDTFRLLSVAFYPPDRQVFLEEKLCSNLEGLLYRLCPEAWPHCLTMEKALQESTAKDLQVEHAALFIGPFELLAPPYGSVYLDGNHKIMGDSTVSVQNMYRQAGLQLEEKEVPDHIALELEFASYLAGKVDEQLNNNELDEMEETKALYTHFLHNTLIRWVPEFCQRIRLETKHAFYSSLSNCLEKFIIKENQNAIRVTSEV